MNWTKVWTFPKIIIINCLVLFIPLAVLDAFFLWGKLDYMTSGVTCNAKLTNYDYCPSITHLRYMNLADGWLPIVNHINGNRRSSYKIKPEFPTNGKRVFLIGDSFIQADELHIEDRFEHSLRQEGFDVHATGYSSWNSRQYNSIVKSISLEKGDSIIIFSMGNDYTPSYEKSTVKTNLFTKNDVLVPTDTRGLLGKIYSNSLTYNTYIRSKYIIDGYFETKGKESSRLIASSHNEKNWMDCKSLPKLYNVGSPLVHDYLSLSKHEECWSRSIQESVKLNLDLLNEAAGIAVLQGASFKVALIPAGWAFTQQNTLGRRHPLYNISEDVVVSQIGLSDKLSREGFDLLDLEELLRDYAVNGKNYLYFSADGHFTKNTHSIIGNHLISILK